MLFELRQYRMRPDQHEQWVQLMETEIIPFQTSKGMQIMGSWVGQEEPDLFIWIRRFESEAERVRLYKEVYESEHWKSVIGPRIPALIDRDQIKVTRMEPTPASVMH